jgi:hypothetical protein
MASQRNTPPDDNNADRVVDADPDPITVRAAQLIRKAAANAAFARAKARFADKELLHAQFLSDEGQGEEADVFTNEAIKLMEESDRIMDQALEEDEEVKQLLDGRRREVSQALTEMPNQSLLTLRDAVSSVREFVENLSDLEIHTLSHASHQSEAMVKHQRDVVVTTGQHIEITLISIEQVRRNPNALAKQLMTFITIALEFANYLPKLHEMVSQLGRLLLQFHP